jgi:uncharacterized protein
MDVQISLPTSQITAFCQRHTIRRLMLFGSVLREDFTGRSDIDLLVEFMPGARVTYLDLAAMSEELEALFNRPVDLGTPASLSPYIRDAVLASARVIYERD